MTTWVEGAAGSPYDVGQPALRRVAHGDEPPRVGRPHRRPGRRPRTARGDRHARGGHVFEAPSLNPLMALGPAGVVGRAGVAGRPAHRPDRARPRRAAPRRRWTRCTRCCPSRSPTTSTSTARSTTPPTSAASSGPDGEPLTPELATPPDRLPRSRRDGGGLRHRRAAAAAAAHGAGPTAPTYGPSRRLDIEAEVGFVVGTPPALGSRVPVEALAEHVFGVTLLNDWSARDIQAWEYVPLGPFLGKSFAPRSAAGSPRSRRCDAAWAALPGQDPAPLDYLAGRRARGARHRPRGAAERRGRQPRRRTPRCTGRRPRCSPT